MGEIVMEDEPIFDFQPLRNFLVQRGYIVEQAQGYRPFTPEVIDPMVEIRRGTMEFRDNGIFVINPDTGDEQQVYVYKHDYWLYRYGNKIPRYHICKCSTICEFMERGAFDGHYVRANTDPVPVRSKETGEEEEVSGMPLCQNCLSKISEYGRITSTQFVECLRAANGIDETETPEEVEVDIFGYTRDWEEISRRYREKHFYTCERCGLRINDFFDSTYIHCHHRDGNKLNNAESNLECLCIRCHSEVDDNHYRKLTSGANREILNEFNRRYPIR